MCITVLFVKIEGRKHLKKDIKNHKLTHILPTNDRKTSDKWHINGRQIADKRQTNGKKYKKKTHRDINIILFFLYLSVCLLSLLFSVICLPFICCLSDICLKFVWRLSNFSKITNILKKEKSYKHQTNYRQTAHKWQINDR